MDYCTVHFYRCDVLDMIFPTGDYLEDEYLTFTRLTNHHLFAKEIPISSLDCGSLWIPELLLSCNLCLKPTK